MAEATSGTAPLAQAASAVRRTWRPFLLIQALAVGFAGAYALSPDVRTALEGVARFRDAGGLPFAAASTVLASVALPELAARLTRARSELTSWRVLALYVGLFALMGSLVFTLQGSLGEIVGRGTDLLTVLKKIAIDQLVFSPFLSAPISTSAFLLRDSGFSPAGVVRRTCEGEWVRRYVPMIVTSWVFWTPLLLAVYAVPVSLQFALFLFIQAAWSLLMIALNARDLRPVEATP